MTFEYTYRRSVRHDKNGPWVVLGDRPHGRNNAIAEGRTSLASWRSFLTATPPLDPTRPALFDFGVRQTGPSAYVDLTKGSNSLYRAECERIRDDVRRSRSSPKIGGYDPIDRAIQLRRCVEGLRSPALGEIGIRLTLPAALRVPLRLRVSDEEKLRHRTSNERAMRTYSCAESSRRDKGDQNSSR